MKADTKKPKTETEVLDPGKRTLNERAAEIDHRHGEVAKTARYALQHWFALGHELVGAKRQVREELGARKWLTWLKENTDVAPRTAQMAMRFAKYETELRKRLLDEKRDVALLSIRPADRILKSIERERNDGGAGESGHDEDQADGEGDAGHEDNPDDGGAEVDDGASGTGYDEPDKRQFEAICRAYEDADELAREAFHDRLQEVYGLEVRPVTQSAEKADSKPAPA